MPPKPALKNTSNREYYTPNPTDDPTEFSDIDFPSSATPPPFHAGPQSPSSHTHSAPHNITTKQTESFIEITREQTPSPSPSDIVAAAHLDDVVLLGSLNREMMNKGVGMKERNRELSKLQGDLKVAQEKEFEKRRKASELEGEGQGDELGKN